MNIGAMDKLALSKKNFFILIAVNCASIIPNDCVLTSSTKVSPKNISAFSYPDAEYCMTFIALSTDVDADVETILTK